MPFCLQLKDDGTLVTVSGFAGTPSVTSSGFFDNTSCRTALYWFHRCCDRWTTALDSARSTCASSAADKRRVSRLTVLTTGVCVPRRPIGLCSVEPSTVATTSIKVDIQTYLGAIPCS